MIAYLVLLGSKCPLCGYVLGVLTRIKYLGTKLHWGGDMSWLCSVCKTIGCGFKIIQCVDKSTLFKFYVYNFPNILLKILTSATYLHQPH